MSPGPRPADPSLVRLKPGKDRPVRLGHPWIFSGAIERFDPNPEPGGIVEVRDAGDRFLGRGYANPRCAIAVRMLTLNDEDVDAAFVRSRIATARAWRRRCIDPDTNAYRLVNGEGDRLPGVLVDVYAEYAVLQLLTAGAERMKPWIVEALAAELGPKGIFERSSGGVRREEGLPSIDAVAAGEAPPELLELRESGHRFLVDLRAGQKTGFYLDQRPNRALAQRFAAGARVLNAFAYTGSFSVYAAAGGAAHVVAVESSARSSELGERNWQLNETRTTSAELLQGDVFAFLRETEQTFDLIILDPPALVKHRRDVASGTRAYKDVNLYSFRRASPGALVMTFTCSQHVDAALFRKIVHGAAADSGRRVQLLQTLGPGPDHPTDLSHLEGEYLHGLLLRVF